MSDQALIEATIAGVEFADETFQQKFEGIKAQAEAGEISATVLRELIDDLRKDEKKLAEIRASRPTGVGGIGNGKKSISEAQAVEGALFELFGWSESGEKILGAEAMNRGRDINARSFVGLCEHVLRSQGREVPASGDKILQAAMTPIRAAHGWSYASLPNVLDNSLNKQTAALYEQQPSVARQLAARRSTMDFKENKALRLSGDNEFLPLGEGGEIKHMSVGEQVYKFSVSTFARMVNMTREDLTNDNLGALSDLPEILARGGLQALEENWWEVVMGNANSFYDVANGNYLTDVLDLAGLTNAISLLRKQVDTNNKPIVVNPRWLVVQPEQEMKARELVNSTQKIDGTSTGTQPAGNALADMNLSVLVSPYISSTLLTGNTATGWFVFSDNVPSYVLAYLAGRQTPTIESQESGFNVLGQAWRGVFDFGSAQMDHRGSVFSTGTG